MCCGDCASNAGTVVPALRFHKIQSTPRQALQNRMQILSHRFLPVQPRRRVLAALDYFLSTTSTADPPRRTRRRHRFGNNTAHIPSFHDFQQQAQARSLYRKFLRLARRDQDYRNQVRNEFRRNASSPDGRRALSEGTRRLKEVQAMLSTVGSSSASPTVPAPSEWPWNTQRQRPVHFPHKS